MLNNWRYIGYYLCKRRETQGGMPRIIEDDRCFLTDCLEFARRGDFEKRLVYTFSSRKPKTIVICSLSSEIAIFSSSASVLMPTDLILNGQWKVVG